VSSNFRAHQSLHSEKRAILLSMSSQRLDSRVALRFNRNPVGPMMSESPVSEEDSLTGITIVTFHELLLVCII